MKKHSKKPHSFTWEVLFYGFFQSKSFLLKIFVMRVTIKIKFSFQNSNSLSSIKIVFEESLQLLLFNDTIFKKKCYKVVAMEYLDTCSYRNKHPVMYNEC